MGEPHYIDDIVRGLLKKLTLYATGRKAGVFDLATLETIRQEHEETGFPMRDLLKSLIRSRVFLETDLSQPASVAP